jgi:hypothetical protein
VTDAPSPSPTDGAESQPVSSSESGWRANVRLAADVVSTLAIPIVTVAATVLGLYATNSLREREIEIARQNNLQSLMNQREQSETALRSAMFKELVGPLLQTGIDAPPKGEQADLPRAQRLALLAELLTLNFHEHFELGPLLRYVDTLPGQTDDARARLRSTARRVISRQLAPLLAAAEGPPGSNPDFVEISLNSDISAPATALLSCAIPGPGSPAAGSAISLDCSASASGSPLKLISPDGRDDLQVSFRAVNWADQTVGIYARVLDAKDAQQTNSPPIEFTLSPYSLPFSDNTLLSSGNRFGIYLTRVDIVPDVVRVMRLSFVWFPKEFVPPRERPLGLDINPPAQQQAQPRS